MSHYTLRAVQNSPARSGIDVGVTIDGTYTIEAVLGRGGMGEVFLASHNRLAGKKVAIKTLHADLSSDEIFARFKREADIASRLDHPNIVKVLDYKQLPDGTPYIVYEYLQGESLAERIVSTGPLPLDQARTILRQVGSALAAAHRAGIVHRDLKPQNIFLTPSEVDGHATEVAKVLDFGISKIRGSQTVKTMESSLLGTPQYMAPEQANGQQSLVDEKTDIFALGAIAYEMLTGRAAFTGASIPEVVFKVVYEQPTPLATLVPAVPPPMVAAIDKAMAKAGADRYATMPQFIEALTGVPLSVMRRPTGAVAPNQLATGNQSKSDEGAFEQTWHSEHGPRPAAAVPSSTIPGAVLPTAPSASAPAPQASRKWSALIGLALVAAVSIGAVTYVATRQRPPRDQPDVVANGGKPSTGPVNAGSAPDAGQPDAASVVANGPPVDATRLIDSPGSAVPPDAKPDATAADPVPVKPDRKAVKKPPVKPADTIADDGPMAQRLNDSEAALRDKAYSRAEQLANTVITSDAASRMQKAHAYTIRGIVDCVDHNSEERAHIALRQVAGFPRLRKRLVAICQAEGHLRAE